MSTSVFSLLRFPAESARQRFRSLLHRQLRGATTLMGEEALRRDSLVVAPHPDDETLGCGGTIARQVGLGASVHILALSDGSGSHAHLVSRESLASWRKEELLDAAFRLGVMPANVIWGGLPDGQLQARFEESVRLVGQALDGSNAKLVFAPLPYAEHPDHIAAYRATVEAVRRAGRPIEIWQYPVWYWRHWPWVSLEGDTRRVLQTTLRAFGGLRSLQLLDAAVDIRATRNRKRNALHDHRTQMTRFVPGTAWSTLKDVSNGEFLETFFQDHELFRTTPSR